jgi:aryl-alcohol dehydrogenase-like predicted oxidoreductase
LDKRQLGESGIAIAPLMFGGNVFGWTADEARSFELLDAFVDAGFDAIDTADGYSAWVPGHSGGESETIIGKWLKQRGGRDKLVIATKVGMWAKRPGLKKANILAAAEESLKRLQTDYIDLYQSHKDDPETPVDEALFAFDELVKAGKVRAIGASNFDAGRLEQSLKVSAERRLARYDTLQPLYNLTDRAGFEDALQPLCVREDVSVIPYYSLASGFLTGKYRSEADLAKSPRGQGAKKYLDDRGRRILEALDEVSARRGATPAQVSLAWLLTRPAVAAPIASATSRQQLDDLVKGVQLKLDREDLKLLETASAPDERQAA